MALRFLFELYLSQFPSVKGFSLIKWSKDRREVICDIQLLESQSWTSLPLKYEGQDVGELVLRSESTLELTEEQKKQLNGVFGPLLVGDLSSQILALNWVKDVYQQLKPNQRDWVGIYWRESFINPNRASSTDLIVGPFIGPWTPHVRIGIDSGLCGLAVREGRTINVDDVRSDDRFLACSTKTRSEIIIPIRDSRGEIVGELDIDSNEVGAFDRSTQLKLQDSAEKLRGQLQI